MDEATLTVHGTLMGTPRYMSPEQAASLQQPVDRRTDMYSLGATLYELATGRPLFESAMPHLVIAQILTEEPARPRQIRPALPRDLETVILTCLAKEPLEAVPECPGPGERPAGRDRRPADPGAAGSRGRTYRALRPPAAEDADRRRPRRGGHRLAHDRRALEPGAITADWRLGRVVLTTDGPSLAAEVLPASSGDRADRRAVRHRCPHRPRLAGRRLPLARQGDGAHESNLSGRGQPRRDANSSPDARRQPLAGRRVHPVFTGHRSRHVDAGQGRLHRVEWRDPDSSRRIDGQADLGRRAARAAVESRARPGRRAAPAVPFRR